MAKFCQKCRKELKNGAIRCIQCGSFFVEEMYAGVWDRFAAYLIDWIIGGIISAVVFFAVGFFLPLLFGQVSGSAIVIGFLIGLISYWLYFAYCESSISQATLGKRVFKIKVTDGDGQPISFPTSLARSFFKILFTITPFGLLALMNAIIIYYSDNKKGIHDYIVNTRVITTNSRVITTKKQEGTGKNILMLIAVGIFIVIFVILAAAVIAAFVFGMVGSINKAPVHSPLPTLIPISTSTTYDIVEIKASIPQDYQNYIDTSMGFEIVYPKNWIHRCGDDNIIDPQTGVAINKTVTFFPGVDYLDFRVTVSIYPKTKITVINETSIQYFISSIKKISKPDAVVILRDENITFYGNTGRKLDYSFTLDVGKYGKKYRSTSLLLIGNEADYVVEYNALDSFYDDYLTFGDTMMNSFKLI